MLIFDNIVYSLQISGGVSRFWSKITEPHLNSSIFIERDDARDNIYRRMQTIKNLYPDHFLIKKISRYTNFRKFFSDTPYVFHSSYYRINSVPGVINVTTVHDLIYERFGSGIGCYLHIAQKRRSLAAADCIVCVSEHTRKDLHYYYPETRDKRVVVISNGVDQCKDGDTSTIPTAIKETAASSPFFLYVGHRGECKGFDRVYQALSYCPSGWRCVVVGDWLSAHEKAEIRSLGLTDRVIAVGRVSDVSLNFLYATAQFFFFPSLYEGFGIPPLEAMQHGCPVLASNRSSIPEVVGDAGVLFDPYDLGSLALGIESVMSRDIRNVIVAKGHLRVADFSWQRAVNAYRHLYDELLNASSMV